MRVLQGPVALGRSAWLAWRGCPVYYYYVLRMQYIVLCMYWVARVLGPAGLRCSREIGSCVGTDAQALPAHSDSGPESAIARGSLFDKRVSPPSVVSVLQTHSKAMQSQGVVSSNAIRARFVPF